MVGAEAGDLLEVFRVGADVFRPATGPAIGNALFVAPRLDRHVLDRLEREARRDGLALGLRFAGGKDAADKADACANVREQIGAVLLLSRPSGNLVGVEVVQGGRLTGSAPHLARETAVHDAGGREVLLIGVQIEPDRPRSGTKAK